MAPVTEHVTIIGNFLMEYYEEEQTELGRWGFLVIEKTKKRKEQTSKIKLLQMLTITSVIVGGTW